MPVQAFVLLGLGIFKAYPPFEPFTPRGKQANLPVSGLRGRAAQQRPKAQIESGAFRFWAKNHSFTAKIGTKIHMAPLFGNT